MDLDETTLKVFKVTPLEYVHVLYPRTVSAELRIVEWDHAKGGKYEVQIVPHESGGGYTLHQFFRKSAAVRYLGEVRKLMESRTVLVRLDGVNAILETIDDKISK